MTYYIRNPFEFSLHRISIEHAMSCDTISSFFIFKYYFTYTCYNRRRMVGDDRKKKKSNESNYNDRSFLTIYRVNGNRKYSLKNDHRD